MAFLGSNWLAVLPKAIRVRVAPLTRTSSYSVVEMNSS